MRGTVIATRVDDDTIHYIDQVQAVHGCDRSEAIRILLRAAIFAPDKVRDIALGYHYGRSLALRDVSRAARVLLAQIGQLQATLQSSVNTAAAMRMIPLAADYPDVDPSTGLARP